MCVCALQLCLTLCSPMDCSPPGSSVRGILQAKNTGVGCHALLQGIFQTQRSNSSLLCLLHWQASSSHKKWISSSIQTDSPNSVLTPSKYANNMLGALCHNVGRDSINHKLYSRMYICAYTYTHIWTQQTLRQNLIPETRVQRNSGQ